MSDSNFVDLVNRGIELAPAEILTINGKTYIDKDKSVTVVKPSYFTGLKTTTLSGIVALLEAGLESMNVNYADLIVQVDSFESVSVYGRLSDDFGHRPSLITAAPIQNQAFTFNQYMPQEQFNIALASLFVPDDSLISLISIAGNLAKQSEVRQEDDGFTQRVTAKQGVHMLSEKVVNPRVTLKPFRTFREAEQPSSDFIFRVKSDEIKGNLCALFEADGGYWKIAAMQNVRIWLQNKLAGSPLQTLNAIPVIY